MNTFKHTHTDGRQSIVVSSIPGITFQIPNATAVPIPLIEAEAALTETAKNVKLEIDPHIKMAELEARIISAEGDIKTLKQKTK